MCDWSQYTVEQLQLHRTSPQAAVAFYSNAANITWTEWYTDDIDENPVRDIVYLKKKNLSYSHLTCINIMKIPTS